MAPAYPEPAPEPEPKKADSGGRFPIVPILIAIVMLAIFGGLGFLALRLIAARRPRFDETARLESSVWLAPVRLYDLQGERMPKASLTIGGPDADIDFGVPGVRARLVPTAHGATRIEAIGDERIFVNGMPLILGQRLSSGQRVKIGVREFVYLEERQPGFRPSQRDGGSALDKPDPRIAAA